MEVCPDNLYRLRAYSLVSIKELLYGELYFSSLHELADPYDTKVYYRFKSDKAKYQRLLDASIGSLLPTRARIDLSVVASQLCGEDLSYEMLVEKISSQSFHDSLLTELLQARIPEAISLCSFLVGRLKHEVHKKLGRFTYITSFSSKIADPLLWSLHAGNHTGYAIKISPVKGALYENPLRRPIVATYLDGSIKYREGRVYPFKEVSYVDQVLPLNGFYNFGPDVYGESVPKESIRDYWKKYEMVTVTKYRKWEFESEYRLVESDWMPPRVTEDGAVLRKSVDRIFYYDQTQLRGIVFGTNMPDQYKDELIRTAEVMRDRLFHECAGCLPVFYFYQAKQDHSRFRIDSEPVLGLDMLNHQFNISEADHKEKEFTEALTFLKNQNHKIEHAGLIGT